MNNDIYQQEKGLGENDRVYLVAATIIATLGIPGKVTPLNKDDLKSLPEHGNTDGEIIIRKIMAFLKERGLPQTKTDLIIRTLQNTLTTENINRPVNGESQLKRVFSKIVDDLGIYYKLGLTIDFTGKLFNEMYRWLGFSQDKLNDVVLTPSYVATLLARLARVNKDSYVWDFATGSAGLLVAAMNEMIIDARNNIDSPNDLALKEAKIKAEQLLGIEVLPSVYILAILNMILMGDGVTNILNKDSIKDFNGTYRVENNLKNFPATAFVLNPPYSAPGKGLNFVEKALSYMTNGYAAVLIQENAGGDQGGGYTQRILKKHTLLASIRMPAKLFLGYSPAQAAIYVFKVGEPHNEKNIVKFIDMSNDGYTRQNRKKSSQEVNLKNTDHAIERYDEVADIVLGRLPKTKFYTKENGLFIEDIISLSGNDWIFSNHIKKEINITENDFRQTLSDFLAFKISEVIKSEGNEHDKPEKKTLKIDTAKWETFLLSDLFDIRPTKAYKLVNREIFNNTGSTPVLSNSSTNNGIGGYSVLEPTEKGNIITFSDTTTGPNTLFYQSEAFIGYPHVQGMYPKNNELSDNLDRKIALFLITVMKASMGSGWSYSNKFRRDKVKEVRIKLPIDNNGNKNWEYMRNYITALELERITALELERITALELERITALELYLKISELSSYELNQVEQEFVLNCDKKATESFKIGDIFKAETGDEDLQMKDINGKGIYFINSGLGNYGIKGKTDKLAKEFPSNTITIDFWGNSFYRDFKYKLATHNHVFSLSSDIIKNRRIGLFLCAQMRYLRNFYSYNNMGTWGKIKTLPLILPIKTKLNGSPIYDQKKRWHPAGFFPDGEYMDTYMKIIEKKVIKGIIEAKDNYINHAKNIIKG